MAGIYIHIPFCKQACHYCDFHFSTQDDYYDRYTDALKQEISMQKDYLNGRPVNTIYFGGGTPSILSTASIGNILDQLREVHPVDPDAEITLEANPDDIEKVGRSEGWKVGKLNKWMEAGINRLSIGIQSFSDADLKFMNRAHDAAMAVECIVMAKDAGFENLSVDLIYGTPSMDDGQWTTNLKMVIDLDLPHVSAYALTVEKGTALDRFIATGKVKPLEDEQASRQFGIMISLLEKHGYDHYEISNFGKPGFHSRHNTSYWKGEHYLGLGPSAHSFDGQTRQWNIANNLQYIRAMESGHVDAQKEVLTDRDRYNEYVMTSLRMMWGTSRLYIEEHFGKPFREHFDSEVHQVDNSHITDDGQVVRLTSEGKLFADKIASSLFIS